MSPECLYWVALLALVMPSAPFNRLALIVLIVWAFGHAVYRVVPFGDAALMFARIAAIGAALAVSHPWDGSRRAYAQATTIALFIPSAFIAAVTAMYFDHPPLDMAEWQMKTALYWSGWSVIMLQAISVPFGNDWGKAVELAKKVDGKIMRVLDNHFA